MERFSRGSLGESSGRTLSLMSNSMLSKKRIFFFVQQLIAEDLLSSRHCGTYTSSSRCWRSICVLGAGVQLGACFNGVEVGMTNNSNKTTTQTKQVLLLLSRFCCARLCATP